MLHVPRTNFLFIHIPRTAGNAITRTLIKELSPYEDFTACLSNRSVFQRHITFYAACKLLNLDVANVNAYAVYRKKDHIIGSDYQLWRAYQGDGYVNANQRRYVEAARANNFLAFKELRWTHWIKNKDPWDFWTGEQVNRLEYKSMKDWWPDLCLAAGCRNVPELPRMDYQKDYFNGGGEA